MPDLYIECFQKMSKEAGYPGLFLVANIGDNSVSIEEMTKRGFDAVTYSNIQGHAKTRNSFMFKVKKKLTGFLFHRPMYTYDYRKKYHDFITEIDKSECVIPQIVPQWDHSPRTGSKGIIYINSTPEYFEKHLREAFEVIKEKPQNRQILMLKSWNEWAEGNYMEPDLKYGKGFIKAMKKIVNEYETNR